MPQGYRFRGFLSEAGVIYQGGTPLVDLRG
jgi:hypothetical protein